MAEDDKPAHHGGSDAVMVYTTWPDTDTAATAAEALVGAGLAACANIFPAVTSIYIWEGRPQREMEVAMILKTRRALIDALMAETRKRHPYETPAILVIELAGGSEPFLAWIERQTSVAQ